MLNEGQLLGLIADRSSVEQHFHTEKCDVFLRYFADRDRGIETARTTLKQRVHRAAYADGLARGRSPSRTRARVGEDIHLEESQLPASQVSLPAATRFSRPSLARASHFYALVSARCNPRRGSTLSQWRIIIYYHPDYHFVEVRRIVADQRECGRVSLLRCTRAPTHGVLEVRTRSSA